MDFGRLLDANLIVVAVTYGWLFAVSSLAGVLGLLMQALLMLSLWRFAYEIARTAAQGRRDIPAPGIGTMHPLGNLALVLHFVFFASLAVLLATTPLLGDGVGATFARSAGLVAVAVAFPASAGLFALTMSLAAALDPRAIKSLIGILGARRYGSVVLFGFGLLVLADAAGRIRWPIGLEAVVLPPLRIWAVLGVFALIGTAIRSRRDVLDIPGEKLTDEEYARVLQQEDWQKQLDLAYASIRSGLLEQGYRTIRTLVAGAGASDDVHQWVLDRMLTWEDRTHALAFAARRVEGLLADGRAYPALELAARCRRDGRFSLEPGTAAALAEYARSIGRHGLADELAG